MRRGLAALASALAVASLPALGFALPGHPAGTQLFSCNVSAEESFSPGVQMSPLSQQISGDLQGPGATTSPACSAAAAAGVVGVAATLTGSGPATCFTDPVLRAVNLTGAMALTWKKADGTTVGTSQARWTASQLDLGSVELSGTVTSGMFKGASLSVGDLSADAVTSVTGGCTPGSPLTGVRTTDTYLRLTQA